MKQSWKIFVIAVIIIIAVFYFYQTQNQPSIKGINHDLANKLTMTVLDVGQGDAILVRTPKGNDILIDGGPDNTIIQKLGEYLPYEDWDIELMILTHPHADHVTGLVEVLKRFKVDKVLTTGVLTDARYYQEWQKIIAEKNIPVEIIDSRRQECVEKNVCFNILFPDHSFDGQTIKNLNNASIVAKLIYASTSAMLMGDYENEETLTGDLSADVLKSGHHGSTNGNNLEFIKRVSPDYAAISVGVNNIYGHPHYRTLKNFERLGVEVFRTDRDGDVMFVSNGLKFLKL